jgi:hypothetical protein
MPNPVVTGFVDAAVAQLRRLDLMRWPGKLPEPMRDASIPASSDWVGWKPIPSTVTDTDLDLLERETGLAFPPLWVGAYRFAFFRRVRNIFTSSCRHFCAEGRNDKSYVPPDQARPRGTRALNRQEQQK